MLISWSLAVLLIAFTLLNVHVSLQFGLLVNLPGPVNSLLNESFHLYYGSYLSPFGVTTLISLTSFAAKAGEFFAIFLIIPLLDRWGRRHVAIHLRLALSIALSTLSLLAILLPSLECFIVSLFLTTIVFQMKFAASGLYVIECCPDQVRGFVTILQSLGEAGASIVALTLSRPSIFGTYEKWWMLPVIAMALCFLSAPLLLWMPETPKRLVATGKTKEAASALRRFHGKDVNTDALIKGCELELKFTSSSDKMSVKESWKDKTIRKVIYLLVALAIALGVSAVMVEMLFSVMVQLFMGIDQESIMTLNSISRIIAIPLSLPTSYFIDRYGRRPLIFASFGILYLKAILMSVGLTIVAFYGPSFLTVVMAIVNDFLSALFTASGSMGISYLFTCELTPLNARVAVSQMTQLIPSILMFPLIALLPMTFTFFPAICYLIPMVIQPPLFYYVYRNLPETMGRRICDIVQDFDEDVRSRAPTSIIHVEERTPLLRHNG